MVLKMINQPTLSTLFLVALAIITCQCAEMDMVQDGPIQFSSRDNDTGLAWPLPDAEDPGMLIAHGAHCFELIQKAVNVSDHMSVMHQQHCRTVIESVLRIFKINPTYHVNEWICNALEYGPLVDILFCYCYGKKSSVNNPLVVRQGQAEEYGKLAGQNFGDLLMKNFTMPQSLNINETAYLQQLESRSATLMGAIGVYCRVKGNIGEIENTLKVQSTKLVNKLH